MGNYQEQYRPQYHFTPSANWLNDPNGMVYYEGEYHLFYQHHPAGTTWGPMHWGHAVSRDLIHWEHLPIAMGPDCHGAIFSGSAVVDARDSSGLFGGKSGLVAFFTHADEYPGTERPRQRQSIAYSKDLGRTWTMYKANPVLSDESITDFRDPKVFWHEAEQRWSCVLAAGDHIRIYSSPNLIDWTWESSFGAGEGSHAGVWECPDLFELPIEGASGEKAWVLVVSIGDDPNLEEGSRTQYFVGRFDGKQFTNDNPADLVLWLDHGRDNYAGVTWSDVAKEDGRRILIGWMNNWKYANSIPTSTWRGAMTLPRVLTLIKEEAGIRVRQQPVREVISLRDSTRRSTTQTIQQQTRIYHAPVRELLELEASVSWECVARFGLKLSTAEQEYTLIGFDAVSGEFYIDRTRSGESGFCPEFACKHGAKRSHADRSTVKLRLFIDQSSVELFADEGRIVLTDQIFPQGKETTLDWFVEGGEITVESVHVHTLKSIYQSAQRQNERKGKEANV